MSQLNTLLERGRIRQTIFGLTRSHANSTKLFSIDKSFSIKQENISFVYEASLEYYNSSFAKDSGDIKHPKDLIDDYQTLITLMFSVDFSSEKSILLKTEISKEVALLDYSLFSLYAILLNYKNIRVAIWKDYRENGIFLPLLYNEIYSVAEQELKQCPNTTLQLPLDKWKRVANNIVWNVKEIWELLDQ